jgi:uncharacterized OB-fold protein
VKEGGQELAIEVSVVALVEVGEEAAVTGSLAGLALQRAIGAGVWVEMAELERASGDVA